MKKDITNMTMAELMAELKESVDAYNLSNDEKERVELVMAQKDIVKKYNELSLLTTYGKCLDAEHPIVALAETYYFPTISVKDNSHSEVVDGVMKITHARSISDGEKRLILADFITWVEELNKSVTVEKQWKVKIAEARDVIEKQWKAFFAAGKDTHAMSIGKTKRALQAMFDALVFIETPTGKNAIIADGKVAKWVLGFANTRKDSKVDGKVTITGSVVSKRDWAILQMDALHMAVTGKDFEIFYGEPEESAENNMPEVETK